MIELLAPAGSMEALKAAVQNGANAVYLGCGTFNARQSAKNFTIQTLGEAVKYCHVRGVQVHLTLNTLVSDREMEECVSLIRQAAAAGVDAFIVQDLGVVELCRQTAPNVPIHGSTQMTIHSLPGVLLCAAWGMQRVVLSRELSREEIRHICANSPIEIEVFAHGALCMCYSGQCYLSAAIGGRSGNRGRCAQPCRLAYGFGRSEQRYPLSLKDNCLVHYLEDLQDMGVASLKLEGRMKKPEYVATVTNVYRKALDQGNVTRNMEGALLTAFNRQGFTDGYYTNNIGPQMFGIREDTTDDPAWVKWARETYEAVENSLVNVTFDAKITATGSQLTVRDADGHVCRAQGPSAEPARNVALTEEALAARLAKTGGTPFRCAGVRAQIEEGVTLSAAAINAMRRDVLAELSALRARREAAVLKRPSRIPEVYGHSQEPVLTVQITTLEQITGRLLKMKPEILYIPAHLIRQEPEFFAGLAQRQRLAVVLPRIVHDGELEALKENLSLARSMGIREALAGNLGHLLPIRECGLRARGDFGLNIYNSRAMMACKNLQLLSATVSFEMTLPQIRDLSKLVDTEMLVYGRMPLMVTENCVIRNRTGQCSCSQGPAKLVDRTGAEFPIIKDGASCRSVVLNGKKLSMTDRKKDLSRMGLWATRLYFTTENRQEVDRVLNDWLNEAPFDPGACTRGLYLRGLD
ncbi:MAG: U32 family peptidase [Oscillospiraceae bacterium]|nr:U32 family peptidase [Oscillospiraceae bacterium]